MDKRILIVILVLVVLLAAGYHFSAPSLSSSGTPDSYSTTGPDAPHVPYKNQVTPSRLQLLTTVPNTKVLDVPEYYWHHGCGPTAVGMLLGYYDNTFGTSYLKSNELSSIASSQHYADYSQPIDNNQPEPLTDRSELGNAHADNSVADYMRTSFSKDNLLYGWSYVSKLVDSIEQYSEKNGEKLYANYYDGFSLSDLKNEINENRPFIVFMNADGVSDADHFATVTGYHQDNLIIQTTWESQPVIETPLLPSYEQFGIRGVILTTNPDGEGIAMPGFEIITFILSLSLILIWWKVN